MLFTPAHVDAEQRCLACHAPVRQGRARADVTVFLDAAPSPAGIFYYVAERGIADRVVEDPYARTTAERFTRHRCFPA